MVVHHHSVRAFDQACAFTSMVEVMVGLSGHKEPINVKKMSLLSHYQTVRRHVTQLNPRLQRSKGQGDYSEVS